MSNAIITVGVSASGKTFWAKDFISKNPSYRIISRDDIRREILECRLQRPLEHGELWGKWKFKDERLVSELVSGAITTNKDKSLDIIIADTNLNKKYRDQLESNLLDVGYNIEYKEFPISFEEAIKRDAGRPDGVGHSVIWKQFKQWQEYIGKPKVAANSSLPKAIIFDVDGTLAQMNGRSPYDWNKVKTDVVRQEIVDMFKGFKAQGYYMIVMSGRDGICFNDTAEWLIDNSIEYDLLVMRVAEDVRKDSIVKEELFFKYVANKFDVKLVVDDRPSVCRTWILLGLPLACVGDPYLEF